MVSGNRSHSSAESPPQRKPGIPPLIENFSQCMPPSVTSDTFSKGRRLPSRRTTCHSSTLLQRRLILAPPHSSDTCLPSPSTTALYSMSPVKGILLQTPSHKTPYHQSVSASTTTISPACKRKTRDALLSDIPHLPSVAGHPHR